MADRKAFEAWHGAYAGVMGKTKDGKYANSIIESQWLAWQEAARQEREACAKVCEDSWRGISTISRNALCDAAEAIRSRSSATGEKG